VPEATDIGNEPQHVLDAYGPECQTPGKFAANCLLARRLAERGVRFIQLY
ncbi:MAG TPA: sulfatase, partial [Planctomycetaceae bacterium]|nr:sulfatase [Planctomycetaceae bacterium]